MEEHKENIQVEDVNVKMSKQREEEEPTKPLSRICSDEETVPKVSSSQSIGDFSHPVYKEIAVANGHINRMSKEELRIKLSELNLDTRGVKDVMKKRLKSHYKKQKLSPTVAACGSNNSFYDYICVVDFEATCEEYNRSDYLHEIIEFPMVLINTHTLEIVDTFREYVKPELNPQLSDFCVNLTGITQKMVDEADTFVVVLRRVVAWLQERELGTKYRYAILTDGAWDMSKFLNIQCRISRIRHPAFLRKWINLRKFYKNFYNFYRMHMNLTLMLEKLGMKYEGRLHSGLDDSRNIGRIAVRMLQDGCQLRINEHMHEGRLHSIPSSAPIEVAPPPHKPRSRD
ncbi:3'-5' exoribonuclease 1 [Gouania willdenowi]|uniref:3'-5' exoribonuclease 1 n=1 Tax=Gouania willdenowi TaxID=441366 RepID=A0A8C5G8P7_GOUWI|nr:3'-5' exoribonuclease 1 [Gouania willdenowi]